MPKSSCKYFSKSAYLACIRRYWAGGALLMLILIMTVLPYYQSISYTGGEIYAAPGSVVTAEERAFSELQNKYSDAGGLVDNLPWLAAIAVGAAIVCAMLVFTYMQDRRAVVMMHSLPIRREAHFISAFLGGLTLIWAPILVSAILFTVVQIVTGNFILGTILIYLLMMFLFSLVTYSLTVFAGQLTGHSIAQFVITALLVVLPFLVELFINMQAELYLFGYSNMYGNYVAVNMEANPLARVFLLLEGVQEWLSPYKPGQLLISGREVFSIILGIFFIAALITVSLLLYRKRKLECAGDFIAVRGMRPVFRFSSAFLMAFLFGSFGATVYNDSRGAFSLFAIIGGIIGFYIADMFVRKTVRVFKNWKGPAAFTVCYLAVMMIFVFDITGYGRYVLPEGQVESIYLGSSYINESSAEYQVKPYPYEFTGGEGMDAALSLQRKIAEQGGKFETGDKTGYTYNESSSQTYTLIAKLKNGKTIRRSYSMLIPTSFHEWDNELSVMVNSAHLQSIEQMRNIGTVVKSVNFHFLTDQDHQSPKDEKLMTRQELIGLFNALASDEARIYDYRENFSGVLLDIYFNLGSAGREYYQEVYVSRDYQHTITWLLENGYLTQEILDQYDAQIAEALDQEKAAEMYYQ